MPDEQMFIRLIEWIEVWLLFSIYHISHVQWKSLELSQSKSKSEYKVQFQSPSQESKSKSNSKSKSRVQV